MLPEMKPLPNTEASPYNEIVNEAPFVGPHPELATESRKLSGSSNNLDDSCDLAGDMVDFTGPGMDDYETTGQVKPDGGDEEDVYHKF